MNSLEPFLPITLPSKCKQYHGIIPDEIVVRPYLGMDEMLLSEVGDFCPDRKYIHVLKNVVKGIDPGNLTLGDRRYIMIWEYVKSYGGIIGESVMCANCLRESSIQVDLRELNAITLPDDFIVPYEIKLPMSGKVVKLRLLTVADEIEACDFEARGNNGLLFRCAKSMVDDSDVLKRIEFLGGLSAMDLASIRAFHEKYEHGPDMRTKFKCPLCGEEDDIEVPFRLDFIFPRGNALTGFVGKGI